MAAATFTFDETRHEYRDEQGLVVPSSTQIIKSAGLISFAGINPAVLQHKQQLGTLVHKVAELYDQGEELVDFEIPEEVWPYVEGYINFRFDCEFTPTLIEEGMLGETHKMRWGMRPDRVGLIRGVPHVIELKCGAAHHPAWGVQLASYELGLRCGSQLLARAAVQLGPQFARNYKLRPYDEQSDYTVFVNSLANTIWKQNKGIYHTEDVPERLALIEA